MGCSKSAPKESGQWNWPEQMHIAAPGRSGLAKYVSWASVLEADTGMAVRVIPETNHGISMGLVKSGKMLLSSGSKSILSHIIEGLEDQATDENGGFQPRIVWIHDLANSGFFVRSDSEIQTIYDITVGTKFSVWNMRESTLNPYRSLLAWIQVDESSIEWINAGSFESAMRAVSEGRADVAFGFPASPLMNELAAAPHGLRLLDLNSDQDPAGAKRWQSISPLYSFGLIESGIDEARQHWGSVGYIFNITSENTDEELIYHLAQWLDEHFEDYEDNYGTNRYMSLHHLMEALKTTFVPVHPGLIRYLEDLGLWTDAHRIRQEENLRLLKRYEIAYSEAKLLAKDKNIEVNPLNDEWLSFWQSYKVVQKIPKLGQHPSLTERADPVYPE
ncbi:TAXI family TRAP transporter solute-binding subunit [Oceanispirochaeta crateris]|nr:TAXI family TRAP transporter solute-binding subunit [Oceanispirochaeta crateris]